jgi:hypothetical protein
MLRGGAPERLAVFVRSGFKSRSVLAYSSLVTPYKLLGYYVTISTDRAG